VVMIDTAHGPNGDHGGIVAAPIFKPIADPALRYLGIPRTINPAPPVVLARHEDAAGPESAVVKIALDSPAGPLPDLRGSSARDAAPVVAEQAAPPAVHVPWTVVDDARLALALLSAAFFGDPSREMQVVGITETNGKTTTAYLMASIFEAAGVRCGLLGTVTYRIGDKLQDAQRTTPEAPD